MLLHAVKRQPRIFIVPGGHLVNVAMSRGSQPRLVRDALAADAVVAAAVAVAPEHDAIPAHLRNVAKHLKCFRHAQ